MSDTPRTDAVFEHVNNLHNEFVCSPKTADIWFVEAEFARQLERELAEAHRTIESLRASVRELIFLHEGARAKDVIQRGKDLLP